MGQGRRWLAGPLVLLSSLAAVAGELPNAASTDRPVLTETVAELRVTAPAALDLAEMAAPPIAIASAPPRSHKVFDKKFTLLAGLAAGLTIADFEMSQRCLRRHTCVETDPLMPTSRAGMYLTNMPLNAGLFWWSYRRKADGKRLWWLAPLTIVGSHAAGVATNFRFIGR